MNKTKIEWTEYTWSPVTGCKTGCPYCYARRIAERFRGTKAFPNGFEPAIHVDRFTEPLKLKRPAKIFVCSMADLFGPWISQATINDVLEIVKACPQHTFQFLTKYPERMAEFNPWPENCWIGTTATDTPMAWEACTQMAKVKARVRFISLEPLLDRIVPQLFGSWLGEGWGMDWVIAGAQTNPYRPPKAEWVEEIMWYCESIGTPVFLKDNLQPLFPGEKLIQEFPKGGSHETQG